MLTYQLASQLLHIRAIASYLSYWQNCSGCDRVPYQSGPEKWRIPRKTTLYPHCRKAECMNFYSQQSLLFFQNLISCSHTHDSLASFFQYDSESDRRCGTEGYTHDASNTQTMCSKWSLSVSRDVSCLRQKLRLLTKQLFTVDASIRQVSEPCPPR